MKFSRKNFFGFCMMVSTLILCLSVSIFAYGAGVQKVIIDSDVTWISDDISAILMCLQADNLDVLGIITNVPYCGFGSIGTVTTMLLRCLEISGHTDIGVYRGSVIPLMRAAERGLTREPEPEEPIVPPFGGGVFPKIKIKDKHAVDFIIETVNANPGEVTLLVLGPWTNIAIALFKDPSIAEKVKEIVVMGGMFGISNARDWPYGVGKVQGGEGNFWADAEAAYVGLHSGIPITISPAELGQWVRLAKEYIDTIIESGTPISELFKHVREERIETIESGWGDYLSMWDETAALYLIAPELMKFTEYAIDIVTSGPAYGLTYIAEPWGRYSASASASGSFYHAEELKPVNVKILYDLDYEAFMDLYVKLMTK